MICLVKNRSKFYNKTYLDVWGQNLLYIKYKSNKYWRYLFYYWGQRVAKRKLYLKEFVYYLGEKVTFRKKKKYKLKYMGPRFLYNYYLIIRRNMFRKYMYKARRKTGSILKHYLIFIEGRLFMLIYRSYFITNIFKIKHIIDRGIFSVNGVIQHYSNYNVKPGEIIQVSFKYKELFLIDLKIRLKRGQILRRVKNYLFINYKFMFIFFLRAPKKKEIRFPIRLDIYRGGDFYFL